MGRHTRELFWLASGFPHLTRDPRRQDCGELLVRDGESRGQRHRAVRGQVQALGHPVGEPGVLLGEKEDAGPFRFGGKPPNGKGGPKSGFWKKANPKKSPFESVLLYLGLFSLVLLENHQDMGTKKQDTAI